MTRSRLTRRLARSVCALAASACIVLAIAAAATAHSAVHGHHRSSASDPSITFTNPLGRSRGPGAGMGLL
jgi:hypothetical protein